CSPGALGHTSRGGTSARLESEAPCGAGPLPGLTHAAEPLHQQRVMGQCLRLVDQRVEHLVVARRRHVELLADRLFLGTGELPPLALEGDDLGVPGRQLGAGIGGRLQVGHGHGQSLTANHTCVIPLRLTGRDPRVSCPDGGWPDVRSVRLDGVMSGSPVRWGILSTGHMAEVLTEDLAHVDGAEVVAVASRDAGRAAAFAERYGIARSHGSYADLAADPAVDVVYIATPHPDHLGSATQCLEGGKAVQCEKPLTVTPDE